MSDRGRRRGAGRPREFELDEVAAAAMETFWGHGFHNVSVTDLELATGTVRTSLYHAFGNKRGLFDAALDHYLDTLSGEIRGWLTNASRGLNDIHTFLDKLETTFAVSGRGCLMVNTMVEFGNVDPDISRRAADYLDTLTAGYRAALIRSRHLREIDATTPIEVIADQLTLQTLGLNLAVRSAPEPRRLRQLFVSTHRVVEAIRSQRHVEPQEV